jgi:hypothetical protein
MGSFFFTNQRKEQIIMRADINIKVKQDSPTFVRLEISNTPQDPNEARKQFRRVHRALDYQCKNKKNYNKVGGVIGVSNRAPNSCTIEYVHEQKNGRKKKMLVPDYDKCSNESDIYTQWHIHCYIIGPGAASLAQHICNLLNGKRKKDKKAKEVACERWTVTPDPKYPHREAKFSYAYEYVQRQCLGGDMMGFGEFEHYLNEDNSGYKSDVEIEADSRIEPMVEDVSNSCYEIYNNTYSDCDNISTVIECARDIDVLTPIIHEQEVSNMNSFNALYIAIREVVGSEKILGVIVFDVEKIVDFPLQGLITVYLSTNLNIELLVFVCGNKVYLFIAKFAYIDIKAPPSEFKINDVLKHGSNRSRIVSKHSVFERRVGKIEFLLCFEYLLALQVVAGATVQDKGFFKQGEIGVDRLNIKFSLLTFEIVRDGLCRECLAHVIKGKLDNPLQKFNLPDIAPLNNIFEDCGVVYVLNNGVYLIIGVFAQMGCRKPACSEIGSQLLTGFSRGSIGALEVQILHERQRLNANGDVTPCEVGANLARQHTAIRASDININIKVTHDRVYCTFPLVYLLDFIEAEIQTFRAVFKLGGNSLVQRHVVRDVGVFEGIKVEMNHAVGRNTPPFQFFHEQQQYARLPATPDTS